MKHNLKRLVIAKLVRFKPTAFEVRKVLRVEVYGLQKPEGKSEVNDQRAGRLLKRENNDNAYNEGDLSRVARVGRMVSVARVGVLTERQETYGLHLNQLDASSLIGQ